MRKFFDYDMYTVHVQRAKDCRDPDPAGLGRAWRFVTTSKL